MINIYCDESCHLEHDGAQSMLMGAISCPTNEKKRIYEEIRAIKERHGLSSWCEIKWTGVSNSKINFYLELIDYFFAEKHLNFRAVVVKNKQNLNHEKYNCGSHDVWYYKAYFYLLDAMIDYTEEYKIFIDLKDTRGGPKVKKLHNVLCNNKYDFRHEVIKEINQIQSHESEIMQLTDLLMGAVSFYHNGNYDKPNANSAKKAIVDKLFTRYRSAIIRGSRRYATKVNIFLWNLVR